MAYKICKELSTIRKSYDTPIEILSGLNFRQKDVIRTVEYYSNSRYLNGQTDELKREKPFYNILNAICDAENAAKDIDTKDITITSDDGQHYIASFLLSKDVYEWMKAENFAKTLNDMRDIHTRYGGLLVKKCLYEDDDGDRKLKLEIPEWKNVMTDQVEISGGAIVETHYMSPTELLAMEEWDQKKIKSIIEKAVKTGLGTRIPVYEVRGDFPKSFIKELEGKRSTKSDETKFSYQLYYLAGDRADTSMTDDTFGTKLLPLYWEDDTERVYKYLARKRKAGRGLGVGVFEEGQEAQVWTNDTVLKQYRAMEYTSKVLGQTASKKLKGRNLLTETDDGQILEHEDSKPITALNLLPSGGLAQYQNLIAQWYAQLEKTTSAYAAQRGETPPSGTPFRLQAVVLQQSSSVFKDLQEELGIFITEIFEDWIMPHLASQLNAKHILAHEFSMEELKEIDKNFSTHSANAMARKMVLSGQAVTPEMYEIAKMQASEFIVKTKGTRFIEIPKDYYKKIKAKITVNVTGEQQNKGAVLESLVNILTVYAKNPALAQDPVLMKIFEKIIELSGVGISPVSLMGAVEEQRKLINQQTLQAQGQTASAPPEGLSLSANPAPNL